MANGAQISQAGQGQLPPLPGSAREQRSAGGYDPRYDPRAESDGHADFVDDRLDMVAEVWRSRSFGETYEADDLGDDGPEGDALEGPNDAHSIEKLHRRAWIRRQLREFLRAVPRQEPDTSIVLPRLDGTTRRLTRGQLTTAIDRMRPRMRQIVRLAVEERWPRQRVCEYLGHISLKTVERDQREALDTLAQL